jgi:hypothetical protein
MEEIEEDRAAVQKDIEEEQAVFKEIHELEEEAKQLEAERARRRLARPREETASES